MNLDGCKAGLGLTCVCARQKPLTAPEPFQEHAARLDLILEPRGSGALGQCWAVLRLDGTQIWDGLEREVAKALAMYEIGGKDKIAAMVARTRP